MKKIVSILTIFILVLTNCGKSDNGSDTPQAPSAPQNVAVTAETLLGTWQLVELETEGRKISQSTDADDKKAWQCGKQGTIAFSSTIIKVTRYALNDDDSCEKAELYNKYVVKNSKIYGLDENNKEVYLFTVSITGDQLTLSEDGNKDKLFYKKSSTTQPTAPVEKQATVEVTVTGSSLDNVKVEVLRQRQERVFEEVDEGNLVGGKVSLDVKKYIGSELYFVLKNKNTDEEVSERVKITITEGKNVVALVYASKVYTANITVTQNNAPLANQKVYALSGVEFSSFASMATFAGSVYDTFVQSVEELYKTKATTNAQGIATFENLKSGQYTFVVLTRTAPYYKSVQLNMNGTAQAGTISLSGSNNQGGGTTPIPTPKGKASVLFWLSGPNGEIILDATIEVNGVVKRTNTNGMATFNDMPENTNINYVITTKTCKKVTRGTHRTGNANTINTVRLDTIDPEEAELILQNNSSNPYTVTIGSRNWVVDGKSSIKLSGNLNTSYEVSWKQNSGYLIYPTTGSEEVSPTCSNKTIKVSFP